MRRIRCSIAAVIAAATLQCLVQPVPASAATPAVSDYVCSHFAMEGWQDKPSSGGSFAFGVSGSGDCVAGTTDYPNTSISLGGTAVLRCGSGITVTGTLTIDDGKHPSVSTSAALTLDGASSGSDGTLALGSGQRGAVETVMTGYIIRLHDFCDSENDPVDVRIDGALAGASASPAVDETAGWVYYSEGYLLGNSTFSLESGSPANGDCDAPDQSVTLQPTETAKDIRELAYNPTTCQFLMETGVPPAAQVTADANADAASNPQLTTTAASTALQTPKTGVGLYHQHGYWRSWYEDPFGIDVTVVGNGTDWNYDGLNVYPPVKGTQHFHWYDPSGWGLFQHDWQNTWDLSHTTSSTYAHFANGSWIGCLNHETHVWFNRNTIHGYADGHIYAVVHATKQGLNIKGCIKSLHFHARLYHG